MRARIAPWSALLLALVATASAGAGRAAAACPPGRFLVRGEPLITGAGVALLPDVVVLSDTDLSITSGCVAVRLHRTHKATRIRARWPRCADGRRNVRLRGTFDASCDALTGRLRTRGRRPRRFVAVRSACGDGTVEPGNAEECDDGNTASGDGCEGDCSFPARSVSGAFVSAAANGTVREQAAVALGIQAGRRRIQFAITPETPDFLLCTLRLFILQGTQQMAFSASSPNPAAAVGLVRYDAFAGCATIFDGVTVTGTLSEFPPWFDPRLPFTVRYDFGNSCRNTASRCAIDVPAAPS